MLEPHTLGLVVGSQSIALITSKHGHVEAVLLKLAYLREEFPGPINGLLLKVVSKGPVAEHFKQRVVVGVNTHLLEVVVLATDAQALLAVRNPRVNYRLGTDEHVFKRIHSRVGKHQRGVVLNHQRSRRHNHVPFRGEKV